MDFSQILQKFSFTEKEIVVYEFMLKQNIFLSAKEISIALKIHIATSYRILDRFVEKGLSEIEKNYGVKCYKAKMNKDLKPYLLIEDQSLLPQVEFFFGRDDMMKMYEDTIIGKPFYAFTNNDNLAPELNEYVFDSYVPERARSNTKAYVIASPFSWIDDYKPEDKKFLRETKVCNKNFNYGETYIYDDFVAIMCARPKEMLGIRMKNSFFAKSMKSMFDLSWDLID